MRVKFIEPCPMGGKTPNEYSVKEIETWDGKVKHYIICCENCNFNNNQKFSDEFRYRNMTIQDAIEKWNTAVFLYKIKNEANECPFCGKKDLKILYNIIDDENYFQIKCNRCGVNTQVYNTKEELINSWNRRDK